MLGFVFSYFVWHYSRSIRELFLICKDFIWFLYHFFSIGVLGRTLFAPWQRLDESYKKGMHVEAFFETFVVNTLMRIVGFLVRSFVIIFGIIVIILACIILAIAFVIWLAMPFIIIILFVSGLRLLLK